MIAPKNNRLTDKKLVIYSGLALLLLISPILLWIIGMMTGIEVLMYPMAWCLMWIFRLAGYHN